MEVKKDTITVRRAGNSQAPAAPADSNLQQEIQQIKQELNNKQPKGSYLKPGDVQGMVSAEEVTAMLHSIEQKVDAKQPAGDYVKPTDIAGMVSQQALNAALADKQPKGNYAMKSEVQTLAGVVDTKQPIGTYATKSDIQSLNATLDTKQAAGNYAVKSEVLTPADQAAALKVLQDTIATKAAKGEVVNEVIITDSANKKWRLRIDSAGVVVTEEYNA